MPRYVVDASVAAKWYFDEDHSVKAASLLADETYELLAPDFIHVEVAAVAWKRVVRGEIEPDAARDIRRELSVVPLELIAATDLLSEALDVALATRRTVYDSIYLAFAIQSGAPLLTGDRKLFEAIRAGDRAAHVAWIGDLPAGP